MGLRTPSCCPRELTFSLTCSLPKTVWGMCLVGNLEWWNWKRGWLQEGEKGSHMCSFPFLLLGEFLGESLFLPLSCLYIGVRHRNSSTFSPLAWDRNCQGKGMLKVSGRWKRNHWMSPSLKRMVALVFQPILHHPTPLFISFLTMFILIWPTRWISLPLMGHKTSVCKQCLYKLCTLVYVYVYTCVVNQGRGWLDRKQREHFSDLEMMHKPREWGDCGANSPASPRLSLGLHTPSACEGILGRALVFHWTWN